MVSEADFARNLRKLKSVTKLKTKVCRAALVDAEGDLIAALRLLRDCHPLPNHHEANEGAAYWSLYHGLKNPTSN
jgi:hypothetical protein